jgi:hypothetical protein
MSRGNWFKGTNLAQVRGNGQQAVFARQSAELQQRRRKAYEELLGQYEQEYVRKRDMGHITGIESVATGVDGEGNPTATLVIRMARHYRNAPNIGTGVG